MLTIVALFDPDPAFELPALDPDEESLPPHAAISTLPPLMAANAPAARPMNARRVVPSMSCSELTLTITCSSRRCCGPAPLSCARPRVVDRRVVPRDQEPLQRHDGEVEQEPEEREHEDHGEQRFGLEVVQARHDAVAEAVVAPEVLADDRADDGEDDPDLHAGEDVRQRARQLEAPERLPPRRVEAAHHVALARVYGADAQDHVQQDREERQQRDDDDLRRDPKAEPHDEQRDQRDLRHDLRRDDHRPQRLLEPDDAAEQRAEAEAERERDGEADEGLRERDLHVGPEAVRVGEVAHAADHVLGLRQHEGRDVEDRDHELPDDDRDDDRDERRDDTAEAAEQDPHSLTPPARATRSSSSASWPRRASTFSWKPVSAVTWSERGRGASTSVIERIRPGRADSSTTRSARKTASAIECVTSTTVALVASAMRWSSMFILSRVIASSAPNGSSSSRISGW